jgi:hypothetical protein
MLGRTSAEHGIDVVIGIAERISPGKCAGEASLRAGKREAALISFSPGGSIDGVIDQFALACRQASNGGV